MKQPGWRGEMAGHMLATPEALRTAGEERTGTVYYEACTTCGYATWRMSSPVPEDELRVVISDKDVSNCGQCKTIYTRLPEVYDWVTQTILHQQRLEKERAAAPPPEPEENAR